MERKRTRAICTDYGVTVAELSLKQHTVRLHVMCVH